jgi:mono/diheme cytochrome c family protein
MVVLALVATVTIAWLADGGDRALASAGADPDDPDQVALGGQVYATYCASCHGANLEGQPGWKRRLDDGGYPAPPHDETGHTWHHADEMLFEYTKRGGSAVIGGNFKSNMPGFGEQITEREIWAVIAFIKSRWPADVRRRQTERNDG